MMSGGFGTLNAIHAGILILRFAQSSTKLVHGDRVLSWSRVLSSRSSAAKVELEVASSDSAIAAKAWTNFSLRTMTHSDLRWTSSSGSRSKSNQYHNAPHTRRGFVANSAQKESNSWVVHDRPFEVFCTSYILHIWCIRNHFRHKTVTRRQFHLSRKENDFMILYILCGIFPLKIYFCAWICLYIFSKYYLFGLNIYLSFG